MKQFKRKNYNGYNLASTTEGVDSIVEHILVSNPDFGDLDKLTEQIEKGSLDFIRDIEEFLSIG